MSTNYPNEMKIEDALELYFKKYHFVDGGYNDKYFKIKIGKIYIPIPNTNARIEAVKLHDIHHLLTEYTADWKGEVEIGAWEIASGCNTSIVAWFLNFCSFSIGLFIYPKELFEAFMKGRNVKTNLYYDFLYNDDLLKRTVGSLRLELEIEKSKQSDFRDYTYFFLCTLIVIFLIIALPILYLF